MGEYSRPARTEEQQASLDPIYRLDAAVADLNAGLGKARADFADAIGEALLAQDVFSRGWSFIRRTWKAAPEAKPAYHFTYFVPSSFDPDFQRLIRETLFPLDASAGRGPPRLAPFFRAFLDHVTAERPTKRIRQAVDRLRCGSGLPEDMHHDLLTVYSGMTSRGFIPGTLDERYRIPLHEKKDSAGRGYIVETVEPQGENSLPGLAVTPILLTGSDRTVPERETIDQLHLMMEPGDDLARMGDVQAFFVDTLEPWFRGRKVREEAASAGHVMLWLPVYEVYARERFDGCFQGWLFQQLSEPGLSPNNASSLTTSFRDEEKCGALREYLRCSVAAASLFVRDLHTIAVREMLAQDFSSAISPAQYVSDNLYLANGWKSVVPCSTAEGERGTSGSSISVRLAPGLFDDPLLWGGDLERARDATLADASFLTLEPRLGEFFITPDYASLTEHRIRDIYRDVFLTKLRQERASEVEAQRLKADLAATFVHSFLKVGRSIETLLEVPPGLNALKRLRVDLEFGAAHEITPDWLVPRLREIERGLENDTAAKLFRMFFLPRIENFYNAVQVADRLGDLQPSTSDGITLVSLIRRVFHGRVLKVGRHLQQDGIGDTMRQMGVLGRGRSSDSEPLDEDGGPPHHSIQFDGLNGVKILLPDLSGSERMAAEMFNGVIRSLWEDIVFELFLNALSSEGIGSSDRLDAERITFSWTSEETGGWPVLSVSNTVRLDSDRIEKLRENAGVAFSIPRPSQEHGLRGWGRYGILVTVEKILRVGFATCNYELVDEINRRGVGHFRIRFDPRWVQGGTTHAREISHHGGGG